MFTNHEFIKNGYHYKLVKSQGDIYMFEKKGVEEDWMTYEPKPHWEVVRIVKRKASPNSEEYSWQYPSDSDWGKLGWTILDLAKANDKFNSLTR